MRSELCSAPTGSFSPPTQRKLCLTGLDTVFILSPKSPIKNRKLTALFHFTNINNHFSPHWPHDKVTLSAKKSQAGPNLSWLLSQHCLQLWSDPRTLKHSHSSWLHTASSHSCPFSFTLWSAPFLSWPGPPQPKQQCPSCAPSAHNYVSS